MEAIFFKVVTAPRLATAFDFWTFYNKTASPFQGNSLQGKEAGWRPQGRNLIKLLTNTRKVVFISE
jgi:hypothetical protein